MRDTVVIDLPKAGGFIVWWRDLGQARFISRKTSHAYDLTPDQVKDLPKLIQDENSYKKHKQLTLF